MTGNSDGNVPLHLAVSSEARKQHGTAVVGALLAVCPDAAAKQDGEGQLPLHKLAKCQTEEKGVAQLLLRAHPEAIATPITREIYPCIWRSTSLSV